MKTTSILLVAAMFAASGMAVAANQDAAKPAAAPASASAPTHHRHHKAHKASAAAAKAAPAQADPAKTK